MSSFSLIFALGLSCFLNSTSRLATESTHILIELNQVPPSVFFLTYPEKRKVILVSYNVFECCSAFVELELSWYAYGFHFLELYIPCIAWTLSSANLRHSHIGWI